MIHIIKDYLESNETFKLNELFKTALDKESLPIVDFKNRTISFNKELQFYNKIIKQNLSFDENMYRIKQTFGAIICQDKNIKYDSYKETNIKYKIKIESYMNNLGDKINHGWYPSDTRYMNEVLIQIFKPKTICIFNTNDFGKSAIGIIQNLKYYKATFHLFGGFEFPINYLDKPYKDLFIEEKLENTNDSILNITYREFLFKYLKLKYTCINLGQYADKHNIYIHGNYINDRNMESLIHIIENNIKPDYVFMNSLSYLNGELIINKLLEINKNILIVVNTNDERIKEILITKYNPILLPYLDNSRYNYKSFSPFNSQSHIFCITNIKRNFLYQIFKYPKSTFIDYKFIIIKNTSKNNNIPLHSFDLKKLTKQDYKNTSIYNKEYLLEKFKSEYLKNKTDLDLLEITINNDYIYMIYYMNLIKLGYLYFILNDISIKSVIKTHDILNNYLETLEILKELNNTKINVLDIGTKYGIFIMIFVNIFIINNKFPKTNIISLDNLQSTKWHFVGSYNVNKFINSTKIKWKLIDKYNNINNQLLNSVSIKKYNIVFINDYLFDNIFIYLTVIDPYLDLNCLIFINYYTNYSIIKSIELFMQNNNYTIIDTTDDLIILAKIY
jgi:hypothetical protein